MSNWAKRKDQDSFNATGDFDPKWIEETVKTILDSCHPKQRAFVEDSHRRVSALVGRRGGKTTGQRARFLIRMIKNPKSKCVYIAETRPHAEELMWSPLKDMCTKLGWRNGEDVDFNETKMRLTLLRNGSQLWCLGANDNAEVNKLRGRKFHEVAIDEAASFPRTRLENLIDRVVAPTLGDYRGVLSMFGTPGHILSGPFYDGTRPGSDLHRPYGEHGERWFGWSSHIWTLRDGVDAKIPAMVNAWDEALVEKEAKQWTDDNPIWMREWLGLWSSDNKESIYRYKPHDETGAEWNQWDPERVGPLKIAKLPDRPDWAYVIGMDLGSSDAFAMTIWAFSPSDETRTIYHIYEFAKSGVHSRVIADLLLGPARNHDKPAGIIGEIGWPNAMVADMAHLGGTQLTELQEVYGIRVDMAEKGHKYKLPAIELANGDLIDGHIKILKGSKLEAEMMQLEWVTDEYGKVKENATQANDLCDSFIYARLVIAKLFENGNIAAAEPKKRKSIFDEDDDDPTPTENYEQMIAESEQSYQQLLEVSEVAGDPWGDD